jgi:CheY-like chemotaxis protein
MIKKNLLNLQIEDLQDNMDPALSFISLIIADYNVPKLSGLDVITEAKKLYSEYELDIIFPKVIMLTGIQDKRLRDHCLQGKLVDFFMDKPAPVDLITDTITQVLSRQ